MNKAGSQVEGRCCERQTAGRQRGFPAGRAVLCGLAGLLFAGCHPAVLVHPGSNQATTAPARPSGYSGPMEYLQFDLGNGYRPSSLQVALNGHDISSRFDPCRNATGSCRADAGLDDYPGNPNSLTWTANCNGRTPFCSSGTTEVLFNASPLTFTCNAIGVGFPAEGCMRNGLALKKQSMTSDTVTVTTAYSSAGGDIQVIPEPTALHYLIINNGQPGAPATINIPPGNDTGSFIVHLNQNALGAVTSPSSAITTVIHLRSKGYALADIRVRITL